METLNANDVKAKVRAYVLDATYGEKNKIQDSSLIFKEGFFDSMGFVSLLGFIEETFEVKTTDADLVEENFESIDAITDFVLSKN
jgi:acyl carrier protein